MSDLRTPHLLHVLPTFVPAGLEMRTVNMIAGFGREFRHSILSMDGRTDAVDRLPPDAPVRILPSLPLAGTLSTAHRLRALLPEVAPDLVLTYNWGTFDMLLAARTLGFRRIVHHEDGFNVDEAETLKARRNLARRAVLPGVHRLVVPSERLRDIAVRHWKVPEDKIALIRNGIRLDAHPVADGNRELRRELGIPEDAVVVGGVGHLREEKRFERLLDACALLRTPAHVLIVGDGEMRGRLEERAARPELAGRVHLAGYQAEPWRFYQAMDVFAIPSDTEQMPMCLLEAMAAGLPVVSTDVGDIRSVLPAEQADGLVALAGAATDAAFARALDALLANPGARQRLGRLNRRRVEERFTFDAMLSSYREVYHSALCAGSEGLLPEASDALC